MSREAWWRNLKLVIFFNFQGTVNFVLFLLCSHKLTLSLKLGLLHTLGCILCQVCNFGSSMLNFYYCLAFNILLSWNPKVVLLLSFSPCLFSFSPNDLLLDRIAKSKVLSISFPHLERLSQCLIYLVQWFLFVFWLKYLIVSIMQLLNAKIGNHVEIGANTCIDRGR